MTTVTIGIDLGDKKHQSCVLSATGGKVAEEMVDNTAAALCKYFRPYRGAVVAMETGTHSPWISRLLETLGCRVLVGNARKLRAIWQSSNKSDVRDAEMLARIARFDPPIAVSGAPSQRTSPRGSGTDQGHKSSGKHWTEEGFS